jgi:hypothetical protein
MNPTVNLSCPKCGSAQPQKISSLVATSANAQTSSAGIGNGGEATAIYSAEVTMHGHQQTAMARRFAQPQLISTLPILVFAAALMVSACVLAAIVNGAGHGLMALAFLIASESMLLYWVVKRVAQIHEYNTNSYPTEVDNWSKSYLCHRCDTVYIPE